MKLTDFGLWFNPWRSDRWSSTIPQQGGFYIYYDGACLGLQTPGLCLYMCTIYRHMIKLSCVQLKCYSGGYELDRQLRLEDFDIVENPDYAGDK